MATMNAPQHASTSRDRAKPDTGGTSRLVSPRGAGGDALPFSLANMSSRYNRVCPEMSIVPGQN
jgi:hypothetical protein